MVVSNHLTGNRVELLAQLFTAQDKRPPEAALMLRIGDGCSYLFGLSVVFGQELVDIVRPRRCLVFSRRRGARIPGGDRLPEFLRKFDGLW